MQPPSPKLNSAWHSGQRTLKASWCEESSAPAECAGRAVLAAATVFETSPLPLPWPFPFLPLCLPLPFPF